MAASSLFFAVTDLSLTSFVTEDIRHNLKCIIILEKNSLSITGHCFMYMIISEMVFSSDSINLVSNNNNFVNNYNFVDNQY